MVYRLGFWIPTAVFIVILRQTNGSNECSQLDYTNTLVGKILELERKLVTQNSDLRRQIEELDEKNGNLSQKLDNLTLEINRTQTLQDGQSCNVLFKVQRMTHVNLTSDQILVFDNVISNIGQAYNNNSGVFVAPCRGRYLFSVTVLSSHEGWAHIRLVKNNIELGNFYTGKDEMGSTGSETYVVDLEKEDQMTVRALNHTGYVANVYGYGWTSFLGVLLE